MAKCTGTEHAPYREAPNGWPYGRVECLTCGGFVFENKDGTLRAHVPAKAPNALQAAMQAALKEA